MVTVFNVTASLSDLKASVVHSAESEESVERKYMLRPLC